MADTSLYDQAYAQYMRHADDPVFRLAMEIYLGETFQQMATYHQGQIQAIVDQLMHKELGQVRKSLTKHYLVNRLEEIQKASKKDQQRWNKEGYWVREHGRFARYVGPKAQGPENPASRWSRDVEDPKAFLQLAQHHDPASSHDSDARALGTRLSRAVELPTTNTADHMREVWNRTAEMHNDLFARTNDPRDKQRVQYVIQSPDGSKRIEIPKAGELPDVNYVGGERVHFMTPVGPDNPVHAGGRAINIGMIAGMTPEQAAKVGGVTEGLSSIMGQTSWGKKMQATASTIAALSGGSPAAVQAAAFAHMVNVIGPQASRAFGGKLKQLTYRYTGQEHAPEDWGDVATTGRVADSKGNLETSRSLENKLINDLVVREHALPTRSEYATSLKLGSTTPSHGYILNADGQVVSKATGFSDDWYTPFNLKKLPNLRGGSYVRTRAYGGLTPEDIRMAMRTGAHRATVVSNNGVFTMEFNPKALHWGHRWGFAGGAMVRRYTKALDAIKNKEISDPNIAGADKALKLNAEGYKAAMQDLRMKYPTWVVDPQKSEGVRDPNSGLRSWHEPLSRLGINPPNLEQQGDPEDTDGYISPLNVRASGARWGWAEPGVGQMSLWEDPKSGKHAYHDFDRYRLQEDLLNNIRRVSRGGTTAPTTNGTRPADVRRGPAPVARPMGGGRTVEGTVVSQPTAYTSREGHVSKGEVDQLLGETKRLIMRAHSQGVPFESDSSDANEIVEMLQSTSNFQAHPEYKRLRDKLATDQRFRESFVDELGDQYLAHESSGKASGARQLLVDWETLGGPERDDEEPEVTEEEAGAQARAEEDAQTFRGNSTLPLDRVMNSEAVVNWVGQGAKNEEAFRLWHHHRQRMEEGDQDYKPWRNPQIGQEFRQTNATLANLLSNESRQSAERQAGVEPVRDTGERTTASAPTSFVPARLKQDAKGNPETAAKALYAAITAGRSPEDAGVEVAQTIDTLKSHGKRSGDMFFSRAGAHMEDLFAESLKRGSGRDDLPSDDEIDAFGREHGLDQDW